MQLTKLAWVTTAILITGTVASCNIGKAPEPTPDVNAIYTQAAQTSVAGFNADQTQTAEAVPTATATVQAAAPLPTFAISGTGVIPSGVTPLALGTPILSTPFTLGTLPTNAVTALPQGTFSVSFPVGNDNGMFIGEDPKDSKANPKHYDRGKKFQKSWSLQNVGTSTWGRGYSFAYKDGDNLQAIPREVTIIDDKDFVKPGHSIAFVITMFAPEKPGAYSATWQLRNASGTWFGSLVSVNIYVDK